jgi:hypothetical protein
MLAINRGNLDAARKSGCRLPGRSVKDKVVKIRGAAEDDSRTQPTETRAVGSPSNATACQSQRRNRTDDLRWYLAVLGNQLIGHFKGTAYPSEIINRDIIRIRITA